MPNQNLNNLKPKLETMEPGAVDSPAMPIAMGLQEANDLATVCAKAEVRAKLQTVGLQVARLDELPNVVDATRAAQSEWVVVRDRSKKDAQRELEEQATVQRSEMMDACRWNLRNDRVGLAVVAAIAEGDGIEDKIQDLRDLAKLVEGRLPTFAADTTFDAPNAVTRAISLANDTATGLSRGRLTDEQSRAKDLRDRAYTYLANLVSDVREAGRYAYRDDRAMGARFASAYLRRKRKRATNRAATPAQPTAPTSGPTPAA